MIKKIPRSSNFELLRIIAMFFIVMHHYSRHGGFDFAPEFSTNLLITQILAMGGKWGVNIFILISGYFLCQQQNYRWKSIAKFVFQVTAFSIIISGIFFVINPDIFSKKSLLQVPFPLLFDKWWFATVFFLFILSTPLLCKMLQLTDKFTHLSIIVFLFILWCIIPTVMKKDFQVNELLWFYFLFFVAAYIKKYPSKIIKNQKINACLLLLSVAVIISYFIIFDKTVTDKEIFRQSAMQLTALRSIPATIAAVSAFCLFANMQPFVSKGINTIAASMFGVYLIHEHSLVRPLLWETLFKNSQYQDSNFLVVHSIISIFAVFIGCTILSLIYNLTIEKLFNKILDKYGKKIEEKALHFKNKIT